MRRSASPVRVAQLNLFHPARQSLSWERLPREIQQQSLRLLARLLREHHASVLAASEAKEACDE